MLQALVERETSDCIHLNNRISIEIGTASFRAVRSGTIVAALCDEIAFWRTEDSANPDSEIINAIQPGMSTIPNAMLLALSSPYAKRGELYRSHRLGVCLPYQNFRIFLALELTMRPVQFATFCIWAG